MDDIDGDLWKHNCASIRDLKGWTEVRVNMSSGRTIYSVDNPQVEFRSFLAEIASASGSVWFVRYFFKNEQDAKDFRIRFRIALLTPR